MNPIKELKNLREDGIFKMNHIEWWLMKYEHDYQISKKRVNRKEQEEVDLFNSGNYTNIILKKAFEASFNSNDLIGKKPVDIENEIYKIYKKEREFVYSYEKLDELSEFHKKEQTAKQIMHEYNYLKGDFERKQKWIDKTHEFGFKVCLDLFTNYLDKKGDKFFIIPLSRNYSDFKLYVDTNEFHSLIYLSLFYTKEVEYWFDEIKYLYGIKELFNFSN